MTTKATESEAVELLDQTAQAIGEFVIYFQLFEIAFTFIGTILSGSRTRKAGRRARKPKLFPENANALLDELTKLNLVSHEYAQRLRAVIKARNIVVHRGLVEFKANLEEYHTFAFNLAEEAAGQLVTLLDAVSQWATEHEVPVPPMPPELQKLLGEIVPDCAELMARVRSEYPPIFSRSPARPK